MAILVDVIQELLILFRRPEAFSQLLLVAARMPPHFEQSPQAIRPQNLSKRRLPD